MTLSSLLSPSAAATGTTTTLGTTTTAKLDIKQTFRVKPIESVSAREGESILLRCEIDNQQGDVQWTKDDELLFHTNGKAAARHSYPKHSMVGDMAKGEHILEIEKARLKDSGIYRCQVPPVIDTGNLEDYLIASSNVTIHKWPSQIQLASDTATKQVQNSTPTSPSSSLSKGINGSVDSGNLDDPTTYGKPVYGSATASQLQARDIPSSSKLPSSINHITGPTSFQANNFITPHASTATVTRSSTNYLQSLNLIITWPILLLIIAVVLSLANIYLIYSLVQRHKRQKEGFSQQTDNSLESGSNGGCSATGSAGTGSSRLGTNELSGCELEQLQQNLQDYQQQQHEVQHQQQLQQQQQPQQQEQQAPPQQPYSTHLHPHPHPHPLHYQQQFQNHHTWNGQFLAIQSNGWVLEI